MLWIAIFFFLYGPSSAEDVKPGGEVRVVAKEIRPPPIPTDCHDYKILQTIDNARAKWRSLGITQYRYSVERHAFAELVGWPTSSRLVVTVRNGVAAVGPTELSDSFIQSLSVEGQFESLEKTVMENPDCLKVTFDETFGFASSIYVDPVWDMTDDDVRLVFTDFGA